MVGVSKQLVARELYD